MSSHEESGDFYHNHGKPGDFYRHLVLSLIPDERQKQLEGADFVAVLEGALSETDDDPVPSLGRYIAATGLLACGLAEMIDVVLDNVPAPVDLADAGGKVRYLGTNALRALLPLPQALQGDGGWYSYPDLEGVRAWWRKRQKNLHWNAELDRYVLDPSAIGTAEHAAV